MQDNNERVKDCRTCEHLGNFGCKLNREKCEDCYLDYEPSKASLKDIEILTNMARYIATASRCPCRTRECVNRNCGDGECINDIITHMEKVRYPLPKARRGRKTEYFIVRRD